MFIAITIVLPHFTRPPSRPAASASIPPLINQLLSRYHVRSYNHYNNRMSHTICGREPVFDLFVSTRAL